MNSGWGKLALGDVLTKSERWTLLDAQREYKEVTVRLWGRGVALRGVVTGPEIAGSRRLEVRAGEFIASRIDARNGALGLIPDELDGAVVTNDFPVYAVDVRKLLPGYLHWLSKTGSFVDSCKAASEGTTNRVRLKEDRFLQIEIPLPPLAEQRRIVAKIERLAGKIEEARGLRNEAFAEIDFLMTSATDVIVQSGNFDIRLIKEFCDSPQYGYTASASDQRMGPRMLRITDIQQGIVDWENVPFCSCPNPQQYLLQKDDILFARTGATTGKSYLIQECPEPAVFASYLIRLRVRNKVLPEYLYAFFRVRAIGHRFRILSEVQVKQTVMVNDWQVCGYLCLPLTNSAALSPIWTVCKPRWIG